MRVRPLSPSVLAASLALGASGLLIAVGAPGTVGSAAASSPPVVSRISPVSAPAGTSIPVVIHGHGFDTTAGDTTVSFDGTPALSVDCSAPSKCVAVTPDLSVGPVSVVVSVDGTALNPETLTVDAYAAPVVRLLDNAKGHVVFSVSHLVDPYPAQGAPGYDAVTIDNTTGADQVLTGSAVGTADIAAGTSQTFALLADDGPYLAFTSGTPTASLTVKTR